MMNMLAAQEFTSQERGRRDFLLDFCKTDFDLASDSENDLDAKALRTDYKSIYQDAIRKKIVAMN